MPDWHAELKARFAAQRIDPTLHGSTLDELSAHLEELYESHLARGLTAAEAEQAVREELTGGGLERELRRADRVLPPGPPALGESARHPLEGIGQDFRYALRTLRHSPGFTAAAMLTLALGIGATAAVFSIVNAVLLRPLPFPQAERIVLVWESNPGLGRATASVSYPNFSDWRTQATGFEALGAYWDASSTLASADGADVVRSVEFVHDFFPVTGVAPALGRTFSPEETDPARYVNVVVITDGLWKRRFGSDPGVIGDQLRVDGRTYTVIGVMPPSFTWGSAELFLPIGRQALLPRGDHRLTVIGRLREGNTLDRAHAELVTIASALSAQYPEDNKGWTVRTASLSDWLIPAPVRESLLVLLGAVGIVLIIACANVANLLLVRAVGRRQELAVRVALGARRWRIARQLVTESVVLAGGAAALGLGAGVLLMRLLVAYGPADVPRLNEASFDLTVWVAVLAITLTTVLMCGVVPAMQLSRQQPAGALQSARGSGAASGTTRWQTVFTVTEVAFSVALLIGAGLLLRSAWHLQQVDPGFNVQPLMAMRVNLPDALYATADSRGALYERLLPEIAALPGITNVAASSALPFDGRNTVTAVSVPEAAANPVPLPSADWRIVSPGYFSTLGIPLRGRDFSFADIEPDTPTTIISESAARTYFPGQDPVGRQIRLGSLGNRVRTVIAVAGDVRVFGLDRDPRPMVYYSTRNSRAWNTNTIVWRSVVDPASHAAAVRDIVRRIDSAVGLYEVRTLDDMLAGSLETRRFNLYLLGVFGGIAVLLAAVGLFGVTAYLVSQRTREIGIRLALGATPQDVFRLIVERGLTLAAAGAVIGVTAAFWLTRMMQSLVFAVSTTDPLTFAAVPLALILIALLACYLPARRAMRIDPLTALRAE